MFEYYHQYGIEIRISRIFNTFGTYMNEDDGKVISNFINQDINKKPFTIYGDEQQTSTLCYVKDTIIGLMSLMESDFIGSVNIGGIEELTINEISTLISKISRHFKNSIYLSLHVEGSIKKPCLDVD